MPTKPVKQTKDKEFAAAKKPAKGKDPLKALPVKKPAKKPAKKC